MYRSSEEGECNIDIGIRLQTNIAGDIEDCLVEGLNGCCADAYSIRLETQQLSKITGIRLAHGYAIPILHL